MRFTEIRFGDQGKLWHILVLVVASMATWGLFFWALLH